MARGRAPRRPAAGGDEIPALRQARPRLTLGAASVAGAIGLAVYASLTAATLGGLLGAIGGAGVVVLAAALTLRLPGLIAPALVLLGGEYAGLFLGRAGIVDVRAPLYGAAFFLLAELAFATVELRAGTPEPTLLPRRAAFLAGLALGGIVLGTVVLAAASAPLHGGIPLEAVGVVASLALLLALGRLGVRER
jgi:hypothetical protein